MDNGFRILEHPADMGLEVWGPNLAEVFRLAALGFTSIIVDPVSVGDRERRIVSVRGTDIENLLVRWLSEILYLYDGERFLVSDIEIRSVNETALEAVLKGEKASSDIHQFKVDVKAVTYHQLKVVREGEVWTARVFFDI
jgi:SHS2 domain-containing protein